jgi:hypothetical protein
MSCFAGHFMHVNLLYADAGHTSDFTLKQITAEESRGLCSLKFFYFVNGKTLLHLLLQTIFCFQIQKFRQKTLLIQTFNNLI